MGVVFGRDSGPMFPSQRICQLFAMVGPRRREGMAGLERIVHPGTGFGGRDNADCVMQDGMRSEKGVRLIPSVISSELWHRLWLRHHILSVPERCTPSERFCHKRGFSLGDWIVREEEYPAHLRGQTHESADVKEFESNIKHFRGWVLESPVVTLIHHTGNIEGELGVGVRKGFRT